MSGKFIMSSYFLKILYALLLLLLHTAGANHEFNKTGEVKCIEKERQALLNFKQGIRSDIYGMLSTWRDDQNKADCCKWDGIECSNMTSHVVMLDLRGFDTHCLRGEINISSLIELQNLEYLDLSWHYFTGSQIPELMGSFSKLRYLNLSYSEFYGRIPYQLGNISQLQYLDLGNNYLVGAFPSQLRKLTHLRYLDLNGDNLHGEIPPQLGNLVQLEYLDLGENYLLGAIPSQLGKLTHLQYLDLSGNNLHGEIPPQLANLAQLKYLDLGENYLFGAIPFQIGNLPMLHTLKLRGNNDLNITNIDWLSNVTSLTNLDLSSLPNPDYPHHWLQTISKLPPSLKELRISGCSLTDNDILSLFDSHSNTSTSLTILDLSYNMLTSSTFQSMKVVSFDLQELYLSHNNIVLSSPLYLNFPSLKILDLSYNNMTLSIFQGNFNFGSKLQYLDLENCSLSYSNFLVSSASIVNSSSSLIALELSSNLLTSSAIFHWLSNFTTNLHELSLGANLLKGPIPDSFGKLMNSLEDLSMYRNKLQGEILTSLRNISTLQSLSLSYNNISMEISSLIQNFSTCNRPKFQALYLSGNRITGKIPDLSMFSSLRELYLSHNQLIGEIPESIGLLFELESLDLSNNFLEGDVTESHIKNVSKLNTLDLSRNLLSIKFGTNRVPPLQLSYLRLASCKLGPSFPSWLQTQSQLRSLDISNAGIVDSVPEWFWNKLQSIEWMNMSHNNLKGKIPNLPLTLIGKPYIILDSNQFEGGVPPFLSQASGLFLSKNKISDLFTFLCGQSIAVNLGALDLSSNQIRGQIPDCWEAFKSILFLDLGNNKLSGKIPFSMGTLDNLEALILRNNNLTEELPSTLKNCTNLVMLDMGENMLSGPIPSWIGENLHQLIILSFPINRFSGNLPLHLCYLRHIQLLDLSNNNLSKEIPTCLKNFTAMSEKSINSSQTLRQIYRENNTFYEIYGSYFGSYELYISLMWKGVEHEFKDPELLLKSIDLSNNYLTGELPKEFGYLFGLVSLNLSKNNLSGEIPSEIGNLNFLESLDLSRNNFSGRIPSTLSQIDRLAVLHLSNNSLSGKIPMGRQLQTFDAYDFEGNLDLCGQPLDKKCPEDETPIRPQEQAALEKDERSEFYESLYMSMGIGFFIGFWGLLGPILLRRPWRNAYLRFLNKLVDNIYVMVAVNVAKCHRWLRD